MCLSIQVATLCYCQIFILYTVVADQRGGGGQGAMAPKLMTFHRDQGQGLVLSIFPVALKHFPAEPNRRAAVAACMQQCDASCMETAEQLSVNSSIWWSVYCAACSAKSLRGVHGHGGHQRVSTEATRSSATAEKQRVSCSCLPRLANWSCNAQNTAESQRLCYYLTFKRSDTVVSVVRWPFCLASLSCLHFLFFLVQ